MTSTPKRRNGVSPTTIILVLILLGAVAGASRLVSPPPPGPAKPDVGSHIDPAIQKKQEAARMNHYTQQMREHEAAAKIKTNITPVTDPNVVEITNNFAFTHKAGDAGLKEEETEFKKRSAAYQQFIKERDEAAKKNPPKPPMAPQPVQ